MNEISKEFFVHLIHVIIIGGLFLYVGINGPTIPKIIFPVLIFLGIFVILYHGIKAYNKLIVNKSAWVSYIHIFLVGPLLILIGYYNIDTPRKYFELLIMLGMAAIGYHGYYMYVELFSNNTNLVK